MRLLAALLLLFILSAPKQSSAQFSVEFKAEESVLEALNKVENAARQLPASASILRDGLLQALENLRQTLRETADRLDEQQAQLLSDSMRLMKQADHSASELFNQLETLQDTAFSRIGLGGPPPIRSFRPILVFPQDNVIRLYARGSRLGEAQLQFIYNGQDQLIRRTSDILIDVRMPRANLQLTNAPVQSAALRLSTSPPWPRNWWPWSSNRETTYEATLYVLPAHAGEVVVSQRRDTVCNSEVSWEGSEVNELSRETHGRDLRTDWICSEIPAGATRIKPGSARWINVSNNCDPGQPHVRIEGERRVCTYIYHPGTRARCATRTQRAVRAGATLIFENHDTETAIVRRDTLSWGQDIRIDLRPTPVNNSPSRPNCRISGRELEVSVTTFDNDVSILSSGRDLDRWWFTAERRPSEAAVVIRPYGPNRLPAWSR